MSCGLCGWRMAVDNLERRSDGPTMLPGHDDRIALSTAVTEAFCRVTVLAPGRRVDLSVPARLACAELLPLVVRLAGADSHRSPPVAWALGRIGGPPLRPERSLAQCGVLDGDTLYLVAADRAPEAAVVDDPVEAVAAAVDARGGRWGGRARRRLLVAAGAGLLAAGAAFLVDAGRVAAAPAALVGLACLVAAGTVGRGRPDALAPAALALAAPPWWAVAALAAWGGAGGPAEAAGRPPPGAGIVATALAIGWAAIGAIAGTLAAAGLVPAAAGPGLAVAVAATSVAAWAAAVAVGGLTPGQAAAAVAVALVSVVSALPRLAVRLAGIRADDHQAGWSPAAGDHALPWAPEDQGEWRLAAEDAVRRPWAPEDDPGWRIAAEIRAGSPSTAGDRAPSRRAVDRMRPWRDVEGRAGSVRGSEDQAGPWREGEDRMGWTPAAEGHVGRRLAVPPTDLGVHPTLLRMAGAPGAGPGPRRARLAARQPSAAGRGR